MLKALTTGMPTPFDVATEDVRICGVVVRVDGGTGRASHIERICVDGHASPV
ncbi:MAG: hypothetical protein ABII12_12515 [Planctomycetota bacterium]